MRPTTPISGRFLYIAWDTHLRLIGPFVLSSEVRRRQLAALRGSVASELESISGIGGVRVLESTFVVPLRDGPRFDVALLIDGSVEAIQAAQKVIERSGAAEPSFVASACNVERFGDTDAVNGGPNSAEPLHLIAFGGRGCARVVWDRRLVRGGAWRGRFSRCWPSMALLGSSP